MRVYWGKIIGNLFLSDLIIAQEDGVPELHVDEAKIRYRLKENGVFPASTCATPCAPHQIKVREVSCSLYFPFGDELMWQQDFY